MAAVSPRPPETPRRSSFAQDTPRRSSFAQGGPNKEIEEISEEQAKKAEAEKLARRKANLAQMSLTGAIQLDDALTDLMGGVSNDMTPTQKLEKLMIAAKESGMEVKQLFDYFDKDGDAEITPDEFKEALAKLDKNRNIMKVTDDELNSIVRTFDIDGDGSISIPEFKNFCYSINALCWRAERIRLEAAGETVVFKDSNTKSVTTNRGDPAAAAAAAAEAAAKELKKIHETQHLFWRTREKLDIGLFTAPPKLLIVATYEEAKDKNHELLFIDLNKITEPPQETLDEMAKGKQSSRPEDARKPFAEVIESVRYDFLLDWVVKRITLEAGTVGIKRISGDQEGDEVRVPDPGIGKHVPRATPKEKVDMDIFHAEVSDLQAKSKENSASVAAARRMSQQLSVAIDTFRSLGKKDAKGLKGSARNKYVTAFLRWIRQKEVVQMAAMLEKNTFYQDLLKKQAQQRAAEPVE